MWAFGGALVLTWFSMLDAVVTNPFVRSLVLKVPFGDVYLHNPGRMRYLAVIAIPVLGAIGIQGLRDEPMTARRATRWLAAGALLWLGIPIVMRAYPVHYVFLAVALIVAGFALHALATRRTTWAWAAVAAVLVVELLGSAMWSHATSFGDTVRTGLEGGEHPNLVPQPLPLPEVDAAAFTAPTAFVPRLEASQAPYLTWAPPAAYFEKGYLFMQLEPDWPALAMERGSLFGVRDVLGYNPVQLPRYWDYIRARTELPVFYNASVIDVPTESDVQLLGIRYLIVPTGIASPLPGQVVDQAQGYDLVELDGSLPRASVAPAWTVATSPDRRPRSGADARASTPEPTPWWRPIPASCSNPGQRPAARRRRRPRPKRSNSTSRPRHRPSWSFEPATTRGGPPRSTAASHRSCRPTASCWAYRSMRGRTRCTSPTGTPRSARASLAGLVAWTVLLLAAVAAAITERRRSRAAGPADPPAPTSGDDDR